MEVAIMTQLRHPRLVGLKEAKAMEKLFVY